ncbi:MAG: hydrogenase formation protein HypD [Candidatus Omnitrophota bacterium]
MKYIDEFRNRRLIERLSLRIKQITPQGQINIMEVCGTHTQGFFRFGLGEFLPSNIRLISGPGCPVCVSPQEYINKAVWLSRKKEVIIATFGDMLRVPGDSSTLEKERARQGNISVVYSPLDALTIAERNPKKRVVFLAVGFETTAAAIAASVIAARKRNIANLFFLTSLRLIPPAMEYLLNDKRLRLSGFLCPGHVSAIIGTKPYAFIPKRYKIGCCVAGFEPLDIMEGVYFLLRQIIAHRPCVQNQYSRVVSKEGNPIAKRFIRQAFEVIDSAWRGLGVIAQSGLGLKKAYSRFDAQREFSIPSFGVSGKHFSRCRCGDVLKGLSSPLMCPLFNKACVPDNPRGPCMVSHEGACNVYYRYHRK